MHEEIEKCLSMPCLNGGQCSDFDDHYKCTCEGGWTGPNCEGILKILIGLLFSD